MERGGRGGHRLTDAEQRWIATWSQPDMNRAFSKHNCYLWTESLRGRITRLSWAEENGVESKVSETRRANSRTVGLSWCLNKSHSTNNTPRLSVLFTVLIMFGHSATLSWQPGLHNTSRADLRNGWRCEVCQNNAGVLGLCSPSWRHTDQGLDWYHSLM